VHNSPTHYSGCSWTKCGTDQNFASKSKTFLRQRPNGKSYSENRDQPPPKKNLRFPCTTWTWSNALMPRTTPRTTPNCSFDGSHTFTHLRYKLLISDNKMPHIRPQNYPSRVDRSPKPTTFLIPRPIWPIPSQTASISDQPFCHNALDRQTDRPADGWSECSITIVRFRSIKSDDAAYNNIPSCKNECH